MENWKSNSNKIPGRKSSTIVVAVAVLLKSGSSVTLRFYKIFVPQSVAKILEVRS